MKKFIILLATILLFSACYTTANITDDMSSAELMQRAQEAMDRNNYNVAIQYYQALHERHRNSIDLIITAEYHIAHIHFKQRNFSLAREGMNGVLAYYNTPDEILLPQHFKRLAQIILEQIDERTSRR